MLTYSRNAAVPRCIMLMSVVIVMIKLRWGLDGISRFVRRLFCTNCRRENAEPLRGHATDSGSTDLAPWLDALAQTAGLQRGTREVLDAPTQSTSYAPFCPWDTQAYVWSACPAHTSDLLGLSCDDIDAYLAFVDMNYSPKNVPKSQPYRRRDGAYSHRGVSHRRSRRPPLL